ncbi:hypothetical protein BDY19DRAFT_496876 [Irpex rosettiformis]|uniref:Uncharacterized protein n=1 Tax=Irpex rosettiformis TaxID=378272 RepID=A0ACB8UG67_9APHY|nr:hypothetical protein BDY19DRAFT_496876 [Irpex rosettiformis]
MAAGGAALVAWVISRFVPANAHAYSLLQTAVAFLALASMAVFVVMQHRQENRFLSDMQEMAILVGGFGLFVLALLVAQRALSEQVVGIEESSIVGRIPAGLTAGRRPFPCSPDAIACIVEEWSWF